MILRPTSCLLLLIIAASAQAQRAAPPQPADSTSLVPLTDLGADGKYKGLTGGLYGDGRNTPPDAHLKAAQQLAASIRPLDSDGKPSRDGKVVLLAIGMSNTTQEFSRFKQLADKDPAKSATLVIVDGAQGGKDAAAWAGNEQPWETADRRLAAAGVTPKQVQVVFVKQALIQPARLGEFPKHSDRLKEGFAGILRKAMTRYPNTRLAYLTGRTYGGYATTPLNPEPYAYESAFSVRGLIEDQIAGNGELNYNPAKGPVNAPLALWGPYLWADGVKGRKTDALTYTREDFARDGTHPSDSGRQKVAEVMLAFFKSDPTAKVWFAGGDRIVPD